MESCDGGACWPVRLLCWMVFKNVGVVDSHLQIVYNVVQNISQSSVHNVSSVPVMGVA